MTCVSGVTGSNLKKRIICIMSERAASKLDLSRKLLLGMARLVAVTVPIIFGMVNAPAFAQAPAARPVFEVASVKRNLLGSRLWLVPPVRGRFTATNIPLKLLIGVGGPQKVSGGPSWVVTDGYDVSAIAPEPNVSAHEFSLMMQNLLKDRFALRVHNETHEARVYVSPAGEEWTEATGCETRTMPLWHEGSECRSASWMRRNGRDVRVDHQ
jgi:bla regulator protein blaR1